MEAAGIAILGIAAAFQLGLLATVAVGVIAVRRRAVAPLTPVRIGAIVAGLLGAGAFAIFELTGPEYASLSALVGGIWVSAAAAVAVVVAWVIASRQPILAWLAAHVAVAVVTGFLLGAWVMPRIPGISSILAGLACDRDPTCISSTQVSEVQGRVEFTEDGRLGLGLGLGPLTLEALCTRDPRQRFAVEVHAGGKERGEPRLSLVFEVGKTTGAVGFLQMSLARDGRSYFAFPGKGWEMADVVVTDPGASDRSGRFTFTEIRFIDDAGRIDLATSGSVAYECLPSP